MLLSPKRLITYFYPLLLSCYTSRKYLKIGHRQSTKTKMQIKQKEGTAGDSTSAQMETPGSNLSLGPALIICRICNNCIIIWIHERILYTKFISLINACHRLYSSLQIVFFTLQVFISPQFGQVSLTLAKVLAFRSCSLSILTAVNLNSLPQFLQLAITTIVSDCGLLSPLNSLISCMKFV